MLAHHTVTRLGDLGLQAMAGALADQLATPGPWNDLAFEDRLGLLVDREADARDSRALTRRLKAAKLRYPAAIEDLDLRSPRGLDRTVIAHLTSSSWVTNGHNLIITGPGNVPVGRTGIYDA